MMMQRLAWNLMYLFGKTPWDMGIAPPELRAVVEGGQIRPGGQNGPGRALDLGCGTGTNVMYLVRHGFETIGVDISSRAIAAARRKIERARLNDRAHVRQWSGVYAGDVTRLETLPVRGPFDLALDMGCLHSLDQAGRARYAASLASLMGPGGLYLLYAFSPRQRRGRLVGITPEKARALFVPAFDLLHVAHGEDRGGVRSAWYTFRFEH